MLKGAIYGQCRIMDKEDVYNWIYEDELKLKNQKEIIDKAINELYEFRKSHCIEEDTECKEITHILETLGVEKEKYI